MRALPLLLCMLSIVSRADDLDNLRLKWRQMLAGGATLDTTISQVRSRLTSVQSTGRNDWNSLQKASGRTALWTDLASTTVSADISSTYGRLHDMAIAWATPGQSFY